MNTLSQDSLYVLFPYKRVASPGFVHKHAPRAPKKAGKKRVPEFIPLQKVFLALLQFLSVRFGTLTIYIR